MNSLANDVKIIKTLPNDLVNETRVVKQFISWSGMDYYENEIASLWKDYQVCMLKVYCFIQFCILFIFLVSNISCNHLIIYNTLRLFELPNLIHD